MIEAILAATLSCGGHTICARSLAHMRGELERTLVNRDTMTEANAMDMIVLLAAATLSYSTGQSGTLYVHVC